MFTTTYKESRQQFWGSMQPIAHRWPQARLIRHPIDHEDLTIDVIQAEPGGTPDRVLVITTGQHGMEGYAGSAMLELFVREHLDRLDPASTGLILVHAINPWGMKHYRRVDQDNVDLNRNFLADWARLDRSINRGYREARSFFVDGAGGFYGGFLRTLTRLGVKGLKGATLLGQYEFPQGIYYGGSRYQPSTRVMIDLYRQALQQYDQVLHVDIHTGYGPRYQMSIVNSALEPRQPSTLVEQFGYPLIVRTTPDEFYAIQGDMIDFVYQMAQRDYPTRRLYSTCFEFGTLGDSLLAGVESLRRMVQENRAYQSGAREADPAFRELYCPTEERWRQKAQEDMRQALTGILRAEGFIS